MLRNFSPLRNTQSVLTVDDPFDAVDVRVWVEKNAMRDFSVSACSPRLLIITFHRLGQAGVDHIAHVRFVDAHSKRYGGTDHLANKRNDVRGYKNQQRLLRLLSANLAAVLIDPLCLHILSVTVTQSCVIGQSQ